MARPAGPTSRALPRESAPAERSRPRTGLRCHPARREEARSTAPGTSERAGLRCRPRPRPVPLNRGQLATV